MVNRNVDWAFFRGKVGKWCRVQEPDVEFKRWSINIYPDADSLAKFKKLQEPTDDIDGIMNEVKRDDEGDYFTISRPTVKNFGKGDQPLTPPEILDKDSRLVPRDYPLIGIGSDVTVKAEIYKYNKKFGKGKKGKAIRLIAVKVHELVPADEGDLFPKQQRMIQGLDEAEPQSKDWF